MESVQTGLSVSILIIGNEGSGKKTLSKNIIKRDLKGSELELKFIIRTGEISKKLTEKEIKLIKEIDFIIIIIDSTNLEDFNKCQFLLEEILPVDCFDKLALVVTKVDLNSKRAGNIAVFSRLSIPVFLSSLLNVEIIGNRIKRLIINSTSGKQKPFQGLRTEYTFRFDQLDSNI